MLRLRSVSLLVLATLSCIPLLAPIITGLLPSGLTTPLVSAVQAATDPNSTIHLPLLEVPNVVERASALSASVGKPRGYLITPAELRAIKQKADQGKQPYATNVRELLNHSTMSSSTTWVSQSSLSGNVVCSDGSQRDAAGNLLPKGPIYLIEGSRQVYGKMLTAILRGGSTGEAYARDSRARILDLIDTTGWGGSVYSTDNQCILYMAWYLPSFVMAADLLEDFPSVWTASDKAAFQSWLATQVYPKVAWPSRARINNWGSSGSYAAALVADYLWDSGLTLREYAPDSLSLTPGQAYAQHVGEQLSRISTTVTDRDRKDGGCIPYKGIQPGGGIPDELRRASISNPLSMCTAKYLPSIGGGYASAYSYQQIHLEHLVAHAEFTMRRGDRRLYDSVAGDGSGSILRGIKFIIANPTNSTYSYDWDSAGKAVLYVAQRYYRDTAIGARLYKGEALRSGHTISYGRLTHGFASGESLGSPPTVPPPGEMASPSPTASPTATPVATPSPTPVPTAASCTTTRWTGDGSGSWGKYGEAVSYGAGTSFTLVARSSSGADGMLLDAAGSTTVAKLGSVGSSYTTSSSQSLRSGFLASSSSANTTSAWVEIQACPLAEGVSSPPAPTASPTPVPTAASCTTTRWMGDGSGSWGKYGDAVSYAAGTSFTLVARSSSGAGGMLLDSTGSTTVAKLGSVGSSYTTSSSQSLRSGFLASSSSANTTSAWVEIQACPQ